jgi:hypothetical protein
VIDETHQKPGGEFHSNTVTGSYRIALLPGAKYKIRVEVDNFEPHEDEIDLETLHEYIEVSNNIYVYSEEYKENNDIKDAVTMNNALVRAEEKKALPKPEVQEPTIAAATSTTEEGVKPEAPKTFASEPVKEKTREPVVMASGSSDPCDETLADLSPLIGKDLNVEKNYNVLLNAVGNYCAEKLEFKVQIGAYRFPKNFKYPHLEQFGDARVTDYPDGITRFTMGSFITLKEADALRQQIRQAGTKDAWVIPFFDGERIFMEDLISVNFYNRAIN